MSEAKKLKSTSSKRRTKLELVKQPLLRLDAEQAESAERLAVLKTYKIYIDGKFPRTESGRYYLLKSAKGKAIANVCLSSRKDLKAAVVAARKALAEWSGKSAFNRSQILYRIAEMLEGRRAQFIGEMRDEGSSQRDAERDVSASIDRLVYYAGWADKYQPVFGAVNPVNSSHFNFSVLEPVGVVGVIAPEDCSLLGLVSTIAPVIVGGNSVIALASNTRPLTAVTFAEAIHSSDVPSGVVNILTGTEAELVGQFASHMDINAVWYARNDQANVTTIEADASINVKRVKVSASENWFSETAQQPQSILDFQEIKTAWHPIGI